jgi:putative membrane protein
MALLAAGAVILAWSAVRPHDYFTWLLEVAPILIGVPILFATCRSFPLTPLLYRLLFVHAVILMVGGHYTYAEVPLGFWMKDAFGFARNHYDRIGHLAQGFAFSAFYELVEWATALATGSAATAFLGTQGDPWDTQWDMFLALVGALTSQTLLGRVHDRQLI